MVYMAVQSILYIRSFAFELRRIRCSKIKAAGTCWIHNKQFPLAPSSRLANSSRAFISVLQSLAQLASLYVILIMQTTYQCMNIIGFINPWITSKCIASPLTNVVIGPWYAWCLHRVAYCRGSLCFASQWNKLPPQTVDATLTVQSRFPWLPP